MSEKESNAVTGNITFSREDIDWRVEQKLSRLLAEKELFSDGFYAGVSFVLFFLAVLWIVLGPEVKLLKK